MSAQSSSSQTLVKRAHRVVSFINDILLIPMFTALVVESSISDESPITLLLSRSNLGFCATFLLEWVLGLLTTSNRRGYVSSPANIIDLVSSLPFGAAFQGLRIFRLARLIRLLRVVLRARRYRGRGEQFLRVISVVGATIFAGAMAIQLMEPEAIDYNFGAALWWSLVTVSTVGYGDIYPSSVPGRTVAGVLIIFGMGVAGYLAGFMASILADDPEEEDLRDQLTRLDAKLNRLAAHMDIDVSDLQAPQHGNLPPAE